MKINKSARCRRCMDRVKNADVSEVELQTLCRECNYLKRLDSKEMRVIPVYSLNTLGTLVCDGSPILGRDGLALL